jgi:hypothetical protein
MKTRFRNVLFALFCTVLLAACAGPAKNSADRVRTQGEILIVTSNSMNDSTSSAPLNAGMGQEVRDFAAAMQRELERQGNVAHAQELPAGPEGQKVIASTLGKRPGAYSHLAQVFWKLDEKSNLYLVAMVLPVTYSGQQLQFGKADWGRRYFFAGKGIEPTKTARQLGEEFAGYLRKNGMPPQGAQRQ